MRFLTGQPPDHLTYDDVFMAPSRTSVASRLDADLTSTDGIGTPLPLVVATMTAIAGETMSLLAKRAHGVVVVVDDGRPVGLVSAADAEGADRFAQAHEVMGTDTVLLQAGTTSPQEIFEALQQHHQKAAVATSW